MLNQIQNPDLQTKTSITLQIKCEKDVILTRAVEIMNRHLRQRNCPEISETDHASTDQACLELKINTVLPSEAFQIDLKKDQLLTITGGSSKGVLYGIGKMLRNASFEEGEFKFGSWVGKSIPQKNVRILYLATHFYNYYHVAPLDEIIEYIEDNALRGYNGIMLWVDRHHYSNINDPDNIAFAERIKKLYLAGEKVGMSPVFSGLTNEGYNSTPNHLKATFTGRCFYGTEICPSTNEGMDLILKNHEEVLQLFSDIHFGFLSLWSYDQGGCGCDKCSPWGSNGMLKCARKVAELFHQYHPNGKIIYSTWLFDDNEWEELGEKLNPNNEPWLDYILADSHTNFPTYPLEKTIPGNRPMINFPEISMWDMFPWGALGANPLIKRFQKLWGQVCNHCDGGVPYSEGIFEDLNQALYGGFYWNGTNETSQILYEYFNFELGCSCQHNLSKALDILEKNHSTAFELIKVNTDETIRKKLKEGWIRLTSRNLIAYKEFHDDPNTALAIVSEIDELLPSWGKQSWRWKIILLRAQIDVELKRNNLEISDRCEAAFEELAELFHAKGISEYKVSPPTRESIDSFRTSQWKD